MIKDLEDHIRVIQLGQIDVEAEIKEVRAEYKNERKKYEMFLSRDREKLGYATEQLQSRRCVQMSYVNEHKRVLEKLEIAQAKERAIEEALKKEAEYQK